MWLTPERMRHGLQSVKTFARNAYWEGRKWAQHVDHAAHIFRRGLNAAAGSGLFQDLGQERLLGQGVKALQNFDSVRSRVVEADRRGRQHVSALSEALET